MKTVLVPIDFSENALAAAQYALSCSPQFHIGQVILYHSNTDKNIANEPLFDELEKIRKQLNRKDDVKTLSIVNNDTLADGIANLVKQYRALLVVMGITGRNKVGQKLIGSNVFRILQGVKIPILIIPAKTQFKKIENVALALPIIQDLKDHIPENDIRALLEMLHAKLMVVDIGGNKNNVSKPVLYAGLEHMFAMFDELDPSYHFLTGNNTANSIADFARDNKAQLLVSVLGKHSSLQGIFKPSVTKNLAYQAEIPLLIYHSGSKKVY